ncbi:MAG: NAD(P)H-dependent flavin oxidoreductase, partial [Steroidobacteraceae bacterium]
MTSLSARAAALCERFRMQVPILLAPMAGASAPSLSIAVAEAGGLGACGALLMSPAEIAAWVAEVRARTSGAFQLNLWIPDPPPVRDANREDAVRGFLSAWGPPVPSDAGNATPPDFASQCAAILAARPAIASSVMGLFPPVFVAQLRRMGIAWFATVTTVAEARLAEAAGADVIVAQGMEAGGHRGCFDARHAETRQVGLFALLPAVVDAVPLPVVATGGIADPRGVAAALLLGASAVQIGTALLRCPEAGIHPAWANALAVTQPEDTVISRVFSGRAGRSIASDYVRAATDVAAPAPAPYPVQRGLTAVMRASALKIGDVQRMQAWAGQSAALARAASASSVVRSLWDGATRLLGMDYRPARIGA